MITVSNVSNNQFNNPVNSGSHSGVSGKTYIEHKKPDNRTYKEDKLLDNTFKNRMNISISKMLDIPLIHFPRGLKGAQDYTFFEYLQTAKFPYYVGGPILAALFYAGVKKDNFKSAKAARAVAKHMALGVGLYYLGAAAAKSIINHTVKLSRGIDLRHPVAQAVSTTTNQTGMYKKDVEFHTAYESCEFTRTDLLYDKEGKTPEEINKNYIELGKKYGVKGNPADIDQTVKPLIKKTIIMARAWQYALTAFFVTLGIGMANQPAWTESSADGFKNTIRYGILGRKVSLKNRINNTKKAFYDYTIKPFAKSFMQFWKGHSKASSIVGKSVILATAAATLTAISLIVGKTSARSHKIEKTNSPKENEVQK